MSTFDCYNKLRSLSFIKFKPCLIQLIFTTSYGNIIELFYQQDQKRFIFLVCKK